MRFIATVVLIVVVAGCASNPRVENLSSSERARLARIQIVQGTPDRKYTVIAEVTGLSCNRNKYQAPDITENEAQQGLRIKAVQLGADAVVNTFCQKNSDTDWINNCWASVKCVGDAVKY